MSTVAPVLFVVLEPEPVCGADASELVANDPLEERPRSIRSGFQHSTSPDVHVLKTPVVHFLRFLDRLSTAIHAQHSEILVFLPLLMCPNNMSYCNSKFSLYNCHFISLSYK